MVSYSTLREFYRIPLVKKNREAIKILRDLFYVLIALFRSSKMQEFAQLRFLYFQMIDSFAEYGRVEAKDTVDQLLEISWFRENQRNLYRLLSAYNKVIRSMSRNEHRDPAPAVQTQINRDMDNYFQAYKSLIRFDQNDEKRIEELLESRDSLDEIVRNLRQMLGS